MSLRVQTYMILINVNRSDKLNEKESYLERSSRTDTIQSKGRSTESLTHLLTYLLTYLFRGD